jgi:predicted permease
MFQTLRALRKNPIFALTAVLTIGLGIGGNTAMFSVIRAVLLKPLDYPKPDELVRINGGASPTRFEDLKKNAQSFSEVGAFSNTEDLTLTGASEPQILKAVRVSGNFLSILGRKPALGRSFLPSEDRPGAPPVALISFELWNRLFSRDPRITTRTATLSGVPYSIIGVLPPRFQFPFPHVDVWLTRPSEWSVMPEKSRQLSPFLTLFGRLKPQVTLAQANAELVLVHHRYAVDHPAMLDAKAKSPVEVTLMKDQLVTSVRAMLWMLFGAVGFVLMITCANVASLMLARARSRSREFAVRAAVGASRWHLMSQLLTESLILSIAGALVGLALAAWALNALPALAAFDLPRQSEIGIDWTVLLFALALSVFTALLFGLVPSVSASRPDLINVLRGTGTAVSEGRKINARSFLVVAQVAFSVVLLIGAALMIESLLHLRDVNVGFNPSNLLTVRVTLPPLRYDTEQKQSAFFAELARRAASVPGVQSATAAMTLPMTESAGSPVQDASKPALRLNQRPIATICIVTPGYFRTLEIPFRSGRDFSEHDNQESERVAIVDEALARRFGMRDPVSQHLLIGGINAHPVRIIGVVPAVHQNLENKAWPETVYVAFAQSPQPSALLAVRGQGDPHRLTSEVRKVIQTIDRDLPLSEVHSMEDLEDAELGRHKLVVGLLGSFAGVALLLALIGIYGTISYSVTQRVKELGIRQALGAQRSDIFRLIIQQALLLAVIGIAGGTAGSFWLTKALKGLLFGVTETDPVTFVGISALFVLAALLASYLPAHRAANLDPMAALRL